MSALHDFLAANQLPEGMELLDLAALEEEAQHAAVAADDAAMELAAFVRQLLLGVTAEGVTMSPEAVSELAANVNALVELTSATLDACTEVVAARLGGVS